MDRIIMAECKKTRIPTINSYMFKPTRDSTQRLNPAQTATTEIEPIKDHLSNCNVSHTQHSMATFLNKLPKTLTPTALTRRSFSLWSMKKDPSLESSLTRNRRWIVNNQIKNILLRTPNQTLPVRDLQKKFKTLDLQGKALNWLQKYPCCFDIYLQNDTYYFKLTKRMTSLVEQEELVITNQESKLVEKLAKLLMMSTNHRLNVVKFNELRKIFGFPDDYLIRVLPKYPEIFRVINYGGKRSSMDIELVSWNPNFAISAIEQRNEEPRFRFCLPLNWEKTLTRFNEFERIPYVSPYVDWKMFAEGSEEFEKRAVGLVHELLSLMLWKKASILKLGHFRREFGLPEKLNVFLLRHPGIFYVTNKYRIYTVVLREGYNGSELIDKDPLVVVKEKFGELMQEGLHEYNRRRHALNVEKKKRGMIVQRSGRREQGSVNETSEEDDRKGKQRNLYDPEERKRFYEVLFGDDNP